MTSEIDRSPGLSDEAVDRAAAVLDGAPELAMACHQHPDGDALGSMLALAHLARQQGKAVTLTWPEPFEVGHHYDFLPGLGQAAKPVDFPAAPAVMVAVDCASPARLGGLLPAAEAAGELVVIDHHATNHGFGTVNLVDVTAAASAVVVRRLVGRLGWPLDGEAAIGLYTGLVCDTGRFQYANTTPAVFALAGELAGFEVPIPDITRELFEKHPIAYLRLAAEVLGRAEVDHARRFAAAWVTAEDLRRFGVRLEECEGLIDLVRRTAEAEVACVLKEAPDGTRVSLRAVSDFDVSTVAAAFGGGGHRAAAGFCSPRSVPDVLTAIRERLPVLG